METRYNTTENPWSVSRETRIENLIEDLVAINQRLTTATTADEVNICLQDFVAMISMWSMDYQILKDFRDLVTEISTTVHYVQLHDVPRNALFSQTEKFIETAKKMLEEEKEKEKHKKQLKALLGELIKHSDEIVELIDKDAFSSIWD